MLGGESFLVSSRLVSCLVPRETCANQVFDHVAVLSVWCEGLTQWHRSTSLIAPFILIAALQTEFDTSRTRRRDQFASTR